MAVATTATSTVSAAATASSDRVPLARKGKKMKLEVTPGAKKQRQRKRSVDVEARVACTEATPVSRKRPRRAAACDDFKEVDDCYKDELVKAKQDRVVEGEDAAIVMTTGDAREGTPQRRLVEFVIHDGQGTVQPIEILEAVPLYVTAVVLPFNGLLDKQRGVKCVGFGPLESWCISGYENGAPVVWVCTDMAEYVCTKPAANYRKCYSALWDKCMVCVAVYKALSKPDGGNPDLLLDDLIARLSRSLLAGKNSSLGQPFSRDYLFSIGSFVSEQLIALDVNASGSEQVFNGLPALQMLASESVRRASSALLQSKVPTRNGALVIHEDRGSLRCADSSAPGHGSDAIDNDEKLARLLQEQEDRTANTSRSRRGRAIPKAKVYIKINEDEIANDYPLPAFYKAEELEMDEYELFEDDAPALAPEDLPRRMLHDWTLYNSDFRLMPLELLPMVPGAETDVEVFGSGLMTEDDGSGYSLDEMGDFSKDGVGSGSNSESKPQDSLHGIRIYLSAIKEWMIEFGASMLFISIRTDGAWYRLGKPAARYEAWYKPILKTARLAIKIISMLKNASRVSRLSFSDVIKRLAEQPKDAPTFLSSTVAEVQRYVVVHGQIILQQFAEYPDEAVQKSAFVTGLSSVMEEKHHTKLTLSRKKVVIKKGRNLNPRSSLQPDATKSKPMRATTTKLINRIWSEYYAESNEDGDKCQLAIENENKDSEDVEEEQDNIETENIVPNVMNSQKLSQPRKDLRKKSISSDMKWIGKSIGKTCTGELLYKKASFRGQHLQAGGAILANIEDSSDALLLVEYLYDSGGVCMVHGRLLEKGTNTVLGNAANKREVFLTDRCENVAVGDIIDIVKVELRQRPWGHLYRKENAAADEKDRNRASEREQQELSPEYFCRALYAPEKGAFFSLPVASLALGSGVCRACKLREEAAAKSAMSLLGNNAGFRLEGVEYRISDFLYVEPDAVMRPQDGIAEVEKFKAGRNKGLLTFAICQLLDVKPSSSSNRATAVHLTVRRFYRPEDVDSSKAYKADIREVYYNEKTTTVPLSAVRGKCNVVKQHELPGTAETNELKHLFWCSYIYDPQKGTVKQLPANVRLGTTRLSQASKGKSQSAGSVKAKGKGKLIEDGLAEKANNDFSDKDKLVSLDVFAGCGGLSEGLHQSGITFSKWAIEYDHAAAEAFKMNHSNAEVFRENCNVILRCIMEKGGDLDDCLSTPEAAEMSSKLSDAQKSKLPMPGQVDFISGGPPCQGFSGMNRFNQRAWSKVQCEMILAFLSYADYFRPRYFLLENVRNFVSFNKGQTFRLSLATLLEMGYQVRFGVLQAGNYGVSQSRTRSFIWAASPEEILPEWPEPMHVFASSQLKIPLSAGSYYTAVKDAGLGAALRSMTVRDTIGDLPPVGNGAGKTEISYGKDPESWFQKQIRGEENTLYDHISKEMNELNSLRCQRIPKRPGADWRDLPEEKVKLSTGQTVDLIPWCLPNTADRHNQWKGLFGRLDWDGNFPTSVTDPQPMGKVGMCFHPEQDRIVTVRECARSQGFPDCYKFFGSIQNKHRQIGNAVPPPLAKALGEKLKEAIEAKSQSSVS